MLWFQAFAKQFQMSPDDLDMHVIYDVSHNIAKIEQHWIDGKLRTLLVHRKVSCLVVCYGNTSSKAEKVDGLLLIPAFCFDNVKFYEVKVTCRLSLRLLIVWLAPS